MYNEKEDCKPIEWVLPNVVAKLATPIHDVPATKYTPQSEAPTMVAHAIHS